jgi:sugar phosphate isomerase/epimerase
MRFGAPVYGDSSDPGRWCELLRQHGYNAAYCPVDKTADETTVRAFRQAAEAADILIAEVGAWSNPMHPDAVKRLEAIEHCQCQLDLAERVGARCCVNIVGSCGEPWDGPHPDNLTEETFDLAVETTRTIIDAVKPKRTFYTLEPMPWMYPDSPENYLRLLHAMDRPQFGVHLDPVNMICSPQRYFGNTAFLQECFSLLGPYIKSCHAKDILLAPKLTTHLDEVRPGLGILDYATFLRELDRLDPDTPLMLEHLPTQEEYAEAAGYVRAVAKQVGVTLSEREQ